MKKNKTEKYNSLYKEVQELVTKLKWQLLASDASVGRISVADSNNVIRLDIYSSTMTICFMSKECKPKYYKRATIKKLEQVMKSAFDILWREELKEVIKK